MGDACWEEGEAHDTWDGGSLTWRYKLPLSLLSPLAWVEVLPLPVHTTAWVELTVRWDNSTTSPATCFSAIPLISL